MPDDPHHAGDVEWAFPQVPLCGGGNTASYNGGNGGGVIRLSSSATFNLNGLITSDGGNSTIGGFGGAGAGGSIYINVVNLSSSGTGVMSADGGTLAIGGGGGGRIEGKFQFMPIPYINYNRSVGFTLGALPMAMWNPVDSDTI